MLGVYRCQSQRLGALCTGRILRTVSILCIYVIVIVHLVCDMAQTQHEGEMTLYVFVFICASVYTYTKYLAHCQSSRLMIQIPLQPVIICNLCVSMYVQYVHCVICAGQKQ